MLVVGNVMIREKGENLKAICEELIKHLDKINQMWIQKVNGFVEEALNNIKGGINYEILQCRKHKVYFIEEFIFF